MQLNEAEVCISRKSSDEWRILEIRLLKADVSANRAALGLSEYASENPR